MKLKKLLPALAVALLLIYLFLPEAPGAGAPQAAPVGSMTAEPQESGSALSFCSFPWVVLLLLRQMIRTLCVRAVIRNRLNSCPDNYFSCFPSESSGPAPVSSSSSGSFLISI